MIDYDKVYERQTYLIGGGRERVAIGRGEYLTLFYETWFEWQYVDGRRDQQAVPVQGYVVDDHDVQHRFKTLAEADAMFSTLMDKYAREMGLLALGIE